MQTSQSIGAIAAALVAFQSEVVDPKKGSDNPYFNSKYVPLDALVAAIRKPMANNGLSFMQFPIINDEKVGIKTTILHKSGEYIEGDPLYMKPIKQDPQAIGSAITYAKRYSLSAILGVAWEEDDDGNSASISDTNKNNPSKPSRPVKKEAPKRTPASTPHTQSTQSSGHSRSQMMIAIVKKARSVDNGEEIINEYLKKNNIDTINALSVEKLKELHDLL